ncbi:hypothetical protein GGS26DRAFT_589345 [Hypomontagnella submonticulosa]|nr:hypothetical protein GGS26DRAFT_589345 [Hypomontagnella submonticulosa]
MASALTSARTRSEDGLQITTTMIDQRHTLFLNLPDDWKRSYIDQYIRFRRRMQRPENLDLISSFLVPGIAHFTRSIFYGRVGRGGNWFSAVRDRRDVTIDRQAISLGSTVIVERDLVTDILRANLARLMNRHNLDYYCRHNHRKDKGAVTGGMMAGVIIAAGNAAEFPTTMVVTVAVVTIAVVIIPAVTVTVTVIVTVMVMVIVMVIIIATVMAIVRVTAKEVAAIIKVTIELAYCLSDRVDSHETRRGESNIYPLAYDLLS